jgi:hypothetical protein
MSRVMKRDMELADTVAGRLWRIIDRPMTIDAIEFSYVAMHGPCNRDTMLAELHNLEAARKINRISQGVYEP